MYLYELIIVGASGGKWAGDQIVAGLNPGPALEIWVHVVNECLPYQLPLKCL